MTWSPKSMWLVWRSASLSYRTRPGEVCVSHLRHGSKGLVINNREAGLKMGNKRGSFCVPPPHQDRAKLVMHPFLKGGNCPPSESLELQAILIKLPKDLLRPLSPPPSLAWLKLTPAPSFFFAPTPVIYIPSHHHPHPLPRINDELICPDTPSYLCKHLDLQMT